MTIIPTGEIKPSGGYIRAMPAHLIAKSIWITGCLVAGTVAQVVANVTGLTG